MTTTCASAFARLIRSVGINARPYASAECFLDELVDGEQGCVLLDLTMPRVTGHHVLARLKQLGSRLPVIVVSARDDEMDPGDGARPRRENVSWRKPVDDQALLDAINWPQVFRSALIGRSQFSTGWQRGQERHMR
jgi:FixJ family two-component response regulator